MELQRKVQDPRLLSGALYMLSPTLVRVGELDAACLVMEEAVEIASVFVQGFTAALVRCQLGYVVGLQGDHQRAAKLLERGILLLLQSDLQKSNADRYVEDLAISYVALERPRDAALLWGASATRHEASGSTRFDSAVWRSTELKDCEAAIRARLSRDEFDEVFALGRGLDSAALSAAIHLRVTSDPV